MSERLTEIEAQLKRAASDKGNGTMTLCLGDNLALQAVIAEAAALRADLTEAKRQLAEYDEWATKNSEGYSAAATLADERERELVALRADLAEVTKHRTYYSERWALADAELRALRADRDAKAEALRNIVEGVDGMTAEEIAQAALAASGQTGNGPAAIGAGGGCPKHGVYDGLRCPECATGQTGEARSAAGVPIAELIEELRRNATNADPFLGLILDDAADTLAASSVVSGPPQEEPT